MVRLLPNNTRAAQTRQHLFQSHNGAIAAMYRCGWLKRSLGFNPTMVRLLHAMGACVSKRPAGFNPTMVRLLRRRLPRRDRNDTLVSIPQWCDCCCKGSRSILLFMLGFNPTMVRLLPVLVLLNAILFLGFNPTMVRLLPRQKFRI